MQFSDYVKYLQKLDETTKRLEITDILKDLIDNLDKDEVDKAIYLALGNLDAGFRSENFNIADKMLIRAIEASYKTSEEEINDSYKDSGDLGTVCEILSKKNGTKNNGRTVLDVHGKLLKIATLSGTGSQDAKIQSIVELLTTTTGESTKYIVRIILGTMRLGFTELTVIDALSYLLKDDKSLRKQIEAKYSIHPDIGLLVKKIKQNGIKGIEDIHIELGIPILAQKAQRLPSIPEIIEKMGTVWAEYKFDGVRVQLHMDKNKKIEVSKLEQQSLFGSEEKEQRVFVKTFTRNLEENSYQYPDIIDAVQRQITADSVILDGEAIGYDTKTNEFLPFQVMMQRKRKHGVKEMSKEIPLKYFAFDILYLNGKSLLNEPLTKRKEILKSIVKGDDVIKVDDYFETDNAKGLKEYFDDAREKGLEGLIVKNPEAPYQAGARAYTWVKVKVADEKLLDDTVDCVVLGYYSGKGVRSKFGIGGFVVGIYDENSDTYKTVTKVGTGLKDDEWVNLKELADKVEVSEKPKNVDMDKMYNPDVWLDPQIVVELGADEISKSNTHSAKYALRFPRLIKFRTDKKATDVTTTKEIADLYKMQKRGYY